jgi:phage-related baseplate assembly protein
LDSLSEIFHNVSRLEPQAAVVTLGFTISTTLTSDYIITDELEVTVDGNINFLTTGHLTFKAGENYAEVQAVCETEGEIGNGFAPGQISKLVSDEFLYYKSVENVTESSGGSEEETDTAFYNRMRESEETYSTAGPKGGYEYQAKTVSALICDVYAGSPTPGVVDVRIMCQNGELPEEELLSKVQEHLSEEDIRPLTDKVIVAAPDTVPFNIKATYYISTDSTASTNEIREAVENATENYTLWQTQKMGRDINPSYFNAMLMESGIKRVVIEEPAFTEIPKGSVAVLETCNVTFGGIEDE